jgi:hypothetical protein
MTSIVAAFTVFTVFSYLRVTLIAVVFTAVKIKQTIKKIAFTVLSYIGEIFVITKLAVISFTA